MATMPLFVPAFPDRKPGIAVSLLIALAAGGGAAGLVLVLLDSRTVAVGFAATALLLAGGLVLARRLFRPSPTARDAVPEGPLVQALTAQAGDAIAITSQDGKLVCANDRFETLFGGFFTPPDLPLGEVAVSALRTIGRTAWRDGSAHSVISTLRGVRVTARVERVGEERLIWRFTSVEAVDLAAQVQNVITGRQGDRLGGAGIMAAMLTPDGRVRAANRVFRLRAQGHEEATVEGRDFARFLSTDSHGLVRFEREGLAGTPLRVLQIPFVEGEGAPMLVALLDEEEVTPAASAIGNGATAHVRSLIALLPVGMALIDRDGRFVHMNDAFVRAARINGANPPLYPGDLVVREDKGPLADAIRRFAGGAGHAMDMAIRLADAPEELAGITITGARGLGDAAVLMILKDSGEEGTLKRQVAQATKMQAVGQLAGGVAHDFNNILTAIIGQCDLMLMRHAPGDSDYDDIQQIRANSNRAASLTRQLLAFSRQQTLRPQVLQLPDVISEVSNLLKRLLGETVTLVVKHGRNLGPVRVDPGQFEQVVMNLAVNARDAMQAQNPNGGGTLTIETMAVPAAEVRRMEDDILPVGDYTALRITDTGTGIPPEIMAKIYEPFFTTKEVGKGTGLGLSTVYGIIKQSGGYIFAESELGQGASFTIYLPVHTAPEVATPRTPVREKEKPVDIWGSGTILLVEDETMVRAIAERALTRQGYTVITAEHGEAALELLETMDRPRLLISDVVMPVLDGPSMARQVRARYPDIPILFMSGYAEEQLRRSIDLDNVAFLPKPFSVRQLAEAAYSTLMEK